MLDPSSWPTPTWIRVFGVTLRVALLWAAQHTGLPVVIIAAIALVASFHMFKQSFRFAVQIALTATLLLALAKLGLIRW